MDNTQSIKYFDLNVTLPLGFICIDTNTSSKYTYNDEVFYLVLQLIKFLEEKNVILSKNLILSLIQLDINSFNLINNSLRTYYKSITGVFLRKVFSSSDDISKENFSIEDLITQINMYITGYGLGEFPVEIFTNRICEINKRLNSKDTEQQIPNIPNNNCITVLDYISIDDSIQRGITLLNSPIVLSDIELSFLNELNKFNLLFDLIPKATMKVKENLFNVLGLLDKESIKLLGSDIFKTSTDILRYIYFISDEDYITLPKNPLIKLSTSNKKLVMSLINKFTNDSVYDDMKPYKSQWVSVSRNIFPGSKKFSKFKRAQEIFNALRNTKRLVTFNSISKQYIKDEDYIGLTKHLSIKPGELLRSIDSILRNLNESNISEFIEIIRPIKFNSKLLFKVIYWLKYRSTKSFLDCKRIFNVKNHIVSISNKPVDKINGTIVNSVCEVLEGKFKENIKTKTLFEDIKGMI
jgi:hypothetical protein